MRKLFLLFVISICTVTLSHAGTQLWMLNGIATYNNPVSYQEKNQSRTDVRYIVNLEAYGPRCIAVADFDGYQVQANASTYFLVQKDEWVTRSASKIVLMLSNNLFYTPVPNGFAKGYIKCETIF